MFVRKKPNKSGIISVQVIDKSSGKYRVKKTIGASADEKEVEQLIAKAKRWIQLYKGEIPIDFEGNTGRTDPHSEAGGQAVGRLASCHHPGQQDGIADLNKNVRK